MIIAWINYINLTVARSMERAKEVGVRRVVGAFPKQLVGQFLFEAFVMNLIAFIIALGLIELLLPSFNQLVGRTITFSVWFTETGIGHDRHDSRNCCLLYLWNGMVCTGNENLCTGGVDNVRLSVYCI